MIRLILIVILLAIDIIFSIPLLLIEMVVGLFSKKAKDEMSRFIVRIYLAVIGWTTGRKLVVKGLYNVPKDRAVLYVGNHNSFFDIVFTYPILPRVTGYVAKKELKKIPIFAQLMESIRCLFLDRDNIKEGLKTILAAADNIKNGISVFVFPEGTRSKDGNMLDFKEGSMKIATKAQCTIIPVALSNTAEVFENHFPKIKAVPVIIEFGEPIETKDMDKDRQKHLGKELRELIGTMKEANDKELGL